ncbi:hypothetical protein DSO57_1026062 [Entomophthora muscae]|uniref:Uncharacterized protein n=1 Tax=Entomophthora muscae TaxID=34485 RepID=A0ACC2TDP5_9FUNG|nr:hypothetical protein DSO57_1026062 [Entomophthora muscae]
MKSILVIAFFLVVSALPRRAIKSDSYVHALPYPLTSSQQPAKKKYGTNTRYVGRHDLHRRHSGVTSGGLYGSSKGPTKRYAGTYTGEK